MSTNNLISTNHSRGKFKFKSENTHIDAKKRDAVSWMRAIRNMRHFMQGISIRKNIKLHKKKKEKKINEFILYKSE